MPNSELAFNLVTLPPSEGFQTKGQPSFSDKDSVDEQIYRIPRSALRDKSGRAYAEFKRQLTPRFLVVWRDISFGYAALGVVAVALIAMHAFHPWLTLLAIPLGALSFGFIFAYLNLFFHEAAHWNLAAERHLSDRLADAFIGIFFGQSIAAGPGQEEERRSTAFLDLTDQQAAGGVETGGDASEWPTSTLAHLRSRPV